MVHDWGLKPGPPALDASTLSLGYRGGGTTSLILGVFPEDIHPLWIRNKTLELVKHGCIWIVRELGDAFGHKPISLQKKRMEKTKLHLARFVYMLLYKTLIWCIAWPMLRKFDPHWLQSAEVGFIVYTVY